MENDLFKREVVSKLSARLGNPSRISLGKKLKEAVGFIDISDLQKIYQSKEKLHETKKQKEIRLKKDLTIAKELVYVFLSQFNSQNFYYLKDGIVFDKKINSDLFYSIFSRNHQGIRMHLVIINALMNGTKEKGALIEMTRNYYAGGSSVGEKGFSRQYRLTKNYLGYGFDKVILTTKLAIKRSKKIKDLAIERIVNNPIAMNDINAYLELPVVTKDMVKEYAQYIQQNNIKIKGKELTNDLLEKHLKIFNYLTDYEEEYQGFRIPSLSKHGRIYSSYDMLPRWIRRMYKKTEIDYSALHPNVIVSLFGGGNKRHQSITHKRIADFLGVDIGEIKILHLSFFNEEIYSMYLPKYKGLMHFYNKFYPNLINNVIKDKEDNGYRNTAHLLQGVESKMQAKNIEILNAQGISPLYIFDALAVSEQNAKIVKEVMDATAIEMGVLSETKVETNEYLEYFIKTL